MASELGTSLPHLSMVSTLTMACAVDYCGCWDMDPINPMCDVCTMGQEL